MLHAQAPSPGKALELSSEEIVKTSQAINTRQLPQTVAAKSAVA